MRLVVTRLIGVLGVLLAGCSSAEGPGQGGASTGRVGSPIINGAQDKAHQAVVFVYNSQVGAACTGTIIKAQNPTAYVLTAAHCVLDEQTGAPSPPDMVLMGDDVNYPTAQFKVTKAVADPKYDGQTHDFAVVTVTIGSQQVPVIAALTPGDDQLAIGSSVDFVGYGVTDAVNQQDNSLRMQVNGSIDMLDSLVMQYGQGKSGPCSGDSGGPALVTDACGQLRVAGVTSYGDQYCQQFGVSGRTSGVYASFIAPNIGEPASSGPSTCGSTGSGGSSGSGGPTGSSGSSGSTGTAGSTGSGSTCQFTTGDATCDACAQPSCCSQADACFGNDACVALNDCLSKCGQSQTCQQQCVQQNPAGVKPLQDLLTCVDCSCSQACSGGPPPSSCQGAGGSTGSGGSGSGASGTSGTGTAGGPTGAAGSAPGSGGSSTGSGGSSTGSGGSSAGSGGSSTGAAGSPSGAAGSATGTAGSSTGTSGGSTGGAGAPAQGQAGSAGQSAGAGGQGDAPSGKAGSAGGAPKSSGASSGSGDQGQAAPGPDTTADTGSSGSCSTSGAGGGPRGPGALAALALACASLSLGRGRRARSRRPLP